jgi:hypothetical protein
MVHRVMSMNLRAFRMHVRLLVSPERKSQPVRGGDHIKLRPLQPPYIVLAKPKGGFSRQKSKGSAPDGVNFRFAGTQTNESSPSYRPLHNRPYLTDVLKRPEMLQ